MEARHRILWLTLAITAFVLGVAIWSRNPGLFVLAALGAAAGLTAWTRSGPR
ncbi:hypothetical protein [Phenylobacterium sp.]|uniref:hypothetical protein n=1 Tax=Phenylobacterium sp. TaxID=1871053 RepID=UPI002C630678|nr:hypothetical protein [Phenylobacterium sp.]HVI34195.1 hypothetical protein [Phenylobacterium sp.]